MTAANPAAAPMRRAAPAQRPIAPTRAAVAVGFEDDTEFRLELSDIPRMRESMEVDGLKPTLLSRLFDLVAPLKP